MAITPDTDVVADENFTTQFQHVLWKARWAENCASVDNREISRSEKPQRNQRSMTQCRRENEANEKRFYLRARQEDRERNFL